jgi:hypothetical protein
MKLNARGPVETINVTINTAARAVFGEEQTAGLFIPQKSFLPLPQYSKRILFLFF